MDAKFSVLFLVGALSANTAFAGGIAEPVMEPVVVAEEASSSAGGVIVPLLLLILVAAAIAANKSPTDGIPVGG